MTSPRLERRVVAQKPVSLARCGTDGEPRGGTPASVDAAPGAAECRLPDWSRLPPPDAALRVSVIVPVRDEARRVKAALHALAGQRALDGTPFDGAGYEVILLANNCNDATAAIARRFAADHPAFRLHVVEVRFPAALAHVGHARACLMDEACRRLRRTAGDGGVIASTDGDSRVAADWLAATLAEVAAGADAVGGSIVSTAQAGDPPGLRRLVRRDDTYQRLRARLEHLLDPDAADPWPRHHQHFGASLAVRVDAYRQAGGCPPVAQLEDEALFHALRRQDLAIRHSDKVSVITSGRRAGRVAIGLSQQLREWASIAAANEDPLVADPREWARWLVLRRELRELWLARQPASAAGAALADGPPTRRQAAAAELQRLAALAEPFDLPSRWLRKTWQGAATFGAVWAAIETAGRRSAVAAHLPGVPMRRAMAVLRSLIARHGRSVDPPAPPGTRAPGAGRTRP